MTIFVELMSGSQELFPCTASVYHLRLREHRARWVGGGNPTIRDPGNQVT